VTETSLIVAGSDLRGVSRFCYSLVSLIIPLKWEHLFAPLIPARAVEVLQSPSPFLAGIHTSLLPTVASLAVESHILVNLDDASLTVVGLAPLPPWAEAMLASVSAGTRELGAFVPRFICRALRVQAASNPNVTAKRLQNAVMCTDDAVGQAVIQSQAICVLRRSLEMQKVPKKVLGFLERANGSPVPTPAVQSLADFPAGRTPNRMCVNHR
jgi:hypothetical protein